MSQILYLIIFILLAIIFWGWLHLIAATSYVYSMLENGFSSFVDIASKIATVGTFIWAALTLKGQRTTARESEAERVEGKIIDLLSSKDLKLRRTNARILIHYLDLMNSYSDTLASMVARPIIEEYLSTLKISDLLDVDDSFEDPSGFYCSIEGIKRSYENLKHNPKLDSRLEKRLRTGINIAIKPPGHCIDLWQIVDLLSFILNRDQAVIPSILDSPPSVLTDPHHRFAALFAYYHFYNNYSSISLKSDGALSVSEFILDQPREN